MNDELFNITVSDASFEYLVLQRGSISDLRHDRKAWHAAYIQSLKDDFSGMVFHLPKHPPRVLDVGSGLSGIGVVLNRFYNGIDLTLCDGLVDEPVVTRHDSTFNNAMVASDFLEANGVRRFAICGPNAIGPRSTPFRYDLVLSLKAWCFHFPPEPMLSNIVGSCRKDAVFIIDVRKERPEWTAGLMAAFDVVYFIGETEKSRRFAMRLRT